MILGGWHTIYVGIGKVGISNGGNLGKEHRNRAIGCLFCPLHFGKYFFQRKTHGFSSWANNEYFSPNLTFFEF